MAPAFDRLTTCEFIGHHALELAKLAKAAELPVLHHIAEMLCLEARYEQLSGVAHNKKQLG